MKTITVISGKGGTGKTTVTASLATLAHEEGRRIVVGDTDVDAANLALLFHPADVPAVPFVGGQLAVVDPDACTGCGLCVDSCRYGALSMVDGEIFPVVEVDRLSCEGCAVCTLVCPSQAFSMHDDVTGDYTLSSCEVGPLAFARLGVGGENSGRLVTQVRKVAADEARQTEAEILLIDGPPGTGCPVISAVTGVDLVLLVTEPTPPGISDLHRVLALTKHFNIPAAVVINKADLNPDLVVSLTVELEAQGVEVLGTIPYDEAVPKAQREGVVPIDATTEVGKALRHIYKRLRRVLAENTGVTGETIPSHHQQEARA
ncbi:MAG: (4Fe-4S)-binding protein [Acidobacteria bacterium]|nr:MAG: (4Fe-4S)-binding protein [Acidobacteriota bacterium]